ncbi:MAG: hypothetical protein ABSA22_12525 [Acidimicrobiales bacterium]|jgi:hypothetical protein
MLKTKSKSNATGKFIKQFFYAALAITGLWFAGVGFSRTVLARPLGGDEKESFGGHFREGKPIKLPKNFVPQTGQTYVPGKDGSKPVLINLNQGNSKMDWQAWMSAVHIVLLIVIIAFVLAAIDRELRASRRRRVSN